MAYVLPPFLLLTGASSGIGREMAISLSRRHRLVLAGRDRERLEATRLACESPDRHRAWCHDLADVDGIAASLGACLAAQPACIEAFVHCAGTLSVLPLRSITAAHTQQVMATNVLSAFEITRLLMRKDVNAKRLRNIVFISTIAAQFGAKGFSAYSASKAALDALMRSLAVELAPDVRANSVLPGAVRTPMTAGMFDDPETAARLLRDYPLGVGEPRDVIDAVEFLLSDQSRWITGQQLVVDGGRTANISA
jgi:NAD(P)-dependent dehydrogenase (short-subunit alcohol dehydrogenase family)